MSMKNIDSSAEDFACFLLAEVQAAILNIFKYTTITRLIVIDHSTDRSSLDQSLDQSLAQSIDRSITIDRREIDRDRAINQSKHVNIFYFFRCSCRADA